VRAILFEGRSDANMEKKNSENRIQKPEEFRLLHHSDQRGTVILRERDEESSLPFLS
jgi:hypothetical protein